MEPTRYQIQAQEFYDKWQTALKENDRLERENAKLRNEVTEWRQTCYRLREEAKKAGPETKAEDREASG